jgi:UDP-N-acetylmuramoylalanine--D-glutamate ligase
MIYSGKKAVVLGLGGSGEAAARLLLEEGARVTVCDSGTAQTLLQKAGDLSVVGIHVKLGDDAANDPDDYDICILSPGIDPETPIVRNIVKKQIPIIGEVELAFEECSCPVVAITGTNGKTTTTELVTMMLSGCGLRTLACGNIGLPFSTAVRQSLELDVIVLEVSSFQLETVVQFRADVAVWLNFSPNHLDRYPDVEAYRNAKLRIFERQTDSDFVVVPAAEDLPATSAQKLTFSVTDPNADFYYDGKCIGFRGAKIIDFPTIRLTGPHNAENLMAALAIGHALGVDLARLADAAKDFSPPPHRCEPVAEIGSVVWVNDSKSTTLDAMEKAILSQARPIILIAGGKDKGFEFDELAGLVSKRVKKAVLIGEMRHRIAGSWPDVGTCCVDSLAEAVALAHKLSAPGDAVLFSPGTSSFDMFRSYVERGDQFKSLVHELSKKTNPNTNA